mmetsp:Transcript_40926/g.87913  ORF Transcript_40926/g.87913 Transcript_40926/m.87913 type:complete len:230 (-) Transcript_40926:248-937(-)
MGRRVAKDAFRLACGSRGVEDVKRMVRVHDGARNGLSSCHHLVPVQVHLASELLGMLWTLLDDDSAGLGGGEFDGLLHHWDVGNCLARLQTTSGSQDDDRFSIVDANSQLLGRKPPEDDGMNCTEPGACQHSDGSLGNHRHVEDGPVARFNATLRKATCSSCDQVLQLRVGNFSDGLGHGTVIDDRWLITTRAHVPVHGIVADRNFAATEPLVEWFLGLQQLRVGLYPV